MITLQKFNPFMCTDFIPDFDITSIPESYSKHKTAKVSECYKAGKSL